MESKIKYRIKRLEIAYSSCSRIKRKTKKEKLKNLQPSVFLLAEFQNAKVISLSPRQK